MAIMREGSATAQRADTFLPYMSDALKVRQRVMELLLLDEKSTIVIEWITS